MDHISEAVPLPELTSIAPPTDRTALLQYVKDLSCQVAELSAEWNCPCSRNCHTFYNSDVLIRTSEYEYNIPCKFSVPAFHFHCCHFRILICSTQMNKSKKRSIISTYLNVSKMFTKLCAIFIQVSKSGKVMYSILVVHNYQIKYNSHSELKVRLFLKQRHLTRWLCF
jgi:hypothetical protein